MVDERDIDAAERALGLIPRDGETLADRLLREAWDERLAPLTARVPAASPPDDMFARIEAAIAGETSAAAQDNIVELSEMRRRASRWKAIAGAAMALAAALALYIAVPIISPAEAPKYVAVVTADDGGQAGLIIQVDTGTGIATVIPVTAPPPGQSYEMWHLPEGATRPVSLGLLPQNAIARTTIKTKPGELFAISLEQEGGSPTGQPTLPQFHGTVVEVK